LQGVYVCGGGSLRDKMLQVTDAADANRLGSSRTVLILAEPLRAAWVAGVYGEVQTARRTRRSFTTLCISTGPWDEATLLANEGRILTEATRLMTGMADGTIEPQAAFSPSGACYHALEQLGKI